MCHRDLKMLPRGYTVVLMWGRELCLLLTGLFLSGCAYQFGTSERTLPGGYRQLSIPIFLNRTQEVGLEVPFTNSVIREFEQSRIAEVVADSVAPVRLEGQVESVKYESRAAVQSDPNINALPSDTVLTTSYQIVVRVSLKLRRTSDQAVLWEGEVSNERVYAAPQIGLRVVNSANALYNQSARQLNFVSLADEMMEEAHDRMTENF